MFDAEFENYFRKICQSAFESALPKSKSQWIVKQEASDNLFVHEKIILITIGSHRFRILTALHFTPSPSLSALASSALDLSLKENISKEVLDDFLSEMLNTLVGALKRELQTQVYSLGMSTPSILERNCLNFADVLKLDHEFFIDANTGNGSVFCASFHTSLYGDLQLEQPKTEEDTEIGGLELF